MGAGDGGGLRMVLLKGYKTRCIPIRPTLGPTYIQVRLTLVPKLSIYYIYMYIYMDIA